MQALQAKYDGRFNALPVRTLPRRALHEPPSWARARAHGGPGASPVTWKPQPVYLPPEMADWEKLFGKLDLCQCDECASVYGPSAYLVDVLEFLGDVRVDRRQAGRRQSSSTPRGICSSAE